MNLTPETRNLTHENGHLEKIGLEMLEVLMGWVEALSPTVCDGIQNHTYNAPKWIKLEELAQLFEAVQRKYFRDLRGHFEIQF